MKEDEEEDEMIEKLEEAQKKIKPFFEKVKANLAQRKTDFSKLQALPAAQLYKEYTAASLASIFESWQKDLEM